MALALGTTVAWETCRAGPSPRRCRVVPRVAALVDSPSPCPIPWGVTDLLSRSLQPRPSKLPADSFVPLLTVYAKNRFFWDFFFFPLGKEEVKYKKKKKNSGFKFFKETLALTRGSSVSKTLGLSFLLLR